jgi:hypothetical protein
MRVRYTVTFETWADDSDAAGLALKGLLKVAGRRFGMRCVAVENERVMTGAGRREPRREQPTMAIHAVRVGQEAGGMAGVTRCNRCEGPGVAG